MEKIKNIAVIAHVDHGKTTLIDAMLKQSGIFRKNQKVAERIMDSDALEKERGITIFSKNAAFHYKDYKINIVDTPGHADFGGEVQRILKMVDSVLLIVDAFEGPMAQTEYVLKKSLEIGLNPIVVINKIDRPNARTEEVLEMIFDLFIKLNAKDEQMDFPIIFASAKEGFAKYDLEDESNDLIPLFETIIKYVKNTEGDINKPFQFLVSAIEYNDYLGRLGKGKIFNGKVKIGDEVVLLKRDGESIQYKITKIFGYEGLSKVEINEAYAGDIVSLAGINNIDVGETIADKDNPEPLPLINIDEPTIAISFIVNDGPFAGKEGKYVTSKNLWDRLNKEIQTNVSIVLEKTDSPDTFIVKVRGDLQVAILIEKMRREGYEFQVSKPEVIYRELNGKKTEPIEHAVVNVADPYVGVVIELFGKRKGEMIDMVQGNDGYTRLDFKVPARGLMGFRNEFLTITRGTGTLNHSFYEYEFYKGDIEGRNRGVLIALEKGVSVSYALNGLQDRGQLFIGPGVEVYAGMIIGANSRENDLVVNVCKGKKLTNMRASKSDESINLTPPRVFTIEQALEYIENDELIEITPKNIRLRKRILDERVRKRSSKQYIENKEKKKNKKF